MSKSLFMEPRDPTPLPKFESHADWCRWLWTRRSLADPHRRCMETEYCVATSHRRTEVQWRHPDVSR